MLANRTIAHQIGAILALASTALMLVPRSSFAQSQICLELERRFEAGRPEASAPQMSSFLFSAANGGCAQVATKAMAAGASLDARDREGGTPLTHAARMGRVALVAIMLDHGAAIDHRDIKGSTPLLVAIEKNRPDVVQLLIERGANVQVTGRSGISTVGAAAFIGNADIVEMLLEKGADGRLPDATGKPPILYAAARASVPIVKRLLGLGVDVNAHYGAEQTVLMWAAGTPADAPEAEALRLAAMLLDTGARIDEADDRGRTALMDAAELDHAAMVDLLLARGVDKSVRDKNGLTAADIATNVAIKSRLGS